MPKYFFLREYLKIQTIGWPIYFLSMILINYINNNASTKHEMTIAIILLIWVFNASSGILYLILMTRWGLVGLLLLMVLYGVLAGWMLPNMHIFVPDAVMEVNRAFYARILNRYIGVLFLATSALLFVKSKKNAKLKELEIARRHHKELEAAENKIAFLTSQINPHFLYNVLTHIESGITEQQPEMAGTVNQLAGLMRYNLSVSNRGMVLLRNELKALHKYIQLEKSRFDKCYITWELQGEENWHKIPPGSLLTIVENAFKHGIHSDAKHPIEVCMYISDSEVEFMCINKIAVNKQYSKSTGLGLQNLKQRLELLFPNNHSLEYGEKENEYFEVKLIIR